MGRRHPIGPKERQGPPKAGKLPSNLPKIRKISLLKDVKIRKRFEVKEIKSIYVRLPNWWGHSKDGASKACGEVCGRRRGGEVNEMHGGGMKKWRQYQGRKKH